MMADRAALLEAGSYVDVLDSSLSWRVAQIQEVDAVRGVFIRYDGWGEKWNEWLAAKSPRLAPFRKYTHKYTGQEGSAPRDWTFDPSSLHFCKATLTAALTDLQVFPSAYEITQFFTGRLFTLVDCLLGWRPSDEAELQAALSLFETVVHFAVQWLRELPSRYAQIYQSMNAPDSVLSAKEVAFAAIWPELFMTVERIFGADPRLQDLLATQATDSLQTNGSPYKAVAVSQLLQDVFVNKEDGYYVILQLFQQAAEGKEPIPLDLIPSLPIWVLFHRLKFHPLWQGRFLSLAGALLQRLSHFSETDIRYYDKNTVQKIQEIIKAVARDSNQSLLYAQAEAAELTVCAHLLRSRLLDKRVKGINNLHEAILRGTLNRSDGFLCYRGQKLAEWLHVEKVLEVIIMDRPHYEVVKRSIDVFSFLSEYNLLRAADIEALWASAVDKHESYTRVVYDLLASLADFLPSSLLGLVYKRFKEVTVYSDFLVQSMKKFTLNACSALCRLQKGANQFFLVDFVEVLTSAQVLPAVLIEAISVATVDLYWFDSLRKFQAKVFSQLLSDQAYARAGTLPLSVALQLLRRGSEVQVRELLSRLGPDPAQSLVFRTLSWATARTSKPQSAGDLRLILEFLGTLASKGIRVVSVTERELMVLWNSFTSPLCASNLSEEFFAWLSQCVANKSAFLIEETLRRVFHLFSSLPADTVARLQLESFRCFQQLFFRTNYLHHNLTFKGDFVVMRFGKELIGLGTLVGFVSYGGSAEIRRLAVKLMSQLHLRLNIAVPDRVVESFISSRIEEMVGSAASISGNLSILVGILSEYESITTYKPALSSTKDAETVYYRLTSELTYRSVILSKNERLGFLRKAIGMVLGFSAESVLFEHGANSYSFLDDDRPLCSLNHALFFSVKSSGDNYKFVHIANAIGNNETAVKRLFELLLDERHRDQSWFILSRLTGSEGIKAKVRSLDRDYTDLMDTNSLHKQLLGLKVLQEVVREQDFEQMYTSTRSNELLCNIVAKFISLDEDFVSYFQTYDPCLVSQFAEMHLRLLWKFSRRPSNFDLVLSLANISKCLCELLYLYAQNTDIEPESPQASLPSCVIHLLKTLTVHTEEYKEVKQAIGTYRNLKELIVEALIRPKHARFASDMSFFLLSLSQHPFSVHEEIGSAVLTILESAVSQPEADPQFFSLASKLIQRSSHIAPEPYFASLFAFLQSRAPEESYKAQDRGLTGALKMMRTMLKISPRLCSPEVAQYLLLTCLIDFNETQASQRLLPKCKSQEARLAAFKCLSKLIQQNVGICAMVLNELSAFFSNLAWRKAKLLHWNNSYSPQEKSSTGFVGLKNLGCTCYMNSLLQQLLQLPSFRNGLFQCDLQEAPDQVLCQLQKIAVGLVASDKMFIQARGLCQAYKNWEGLSINPMEQMDVEEFFNGLMDKVETGLKGTARPRLVEEHFKGIYTTQCIGKGSCSHRSERDESFLTLALEIKNKSSILQSLDALTTGEVLEGDNAYACDFCNQKVTASRRICLRSLPNLLLLTLRRFDFDMDTMTRMKLNSYCEFPLTLDMEPYTVEGVLRKEQGGDLDERLGVVRAPEEYYQYSLRGIIIHLGSAEAGHYYSYVKTEEQGWVEFNDTAVDPFDPANIPHEAFGVSPGMLGDASKEEVGKMKNAYILIYERKVKYAVKGKDDSLPELLQNYAGGMALSAQKLLEHYQTSNLKYWKIKRVFSPEFFTFVTKLSSFDTRNALKFCLLYYLTINIRAKDRSVDFFDRLFERVSQSVEMAWWLLEVLSYEPMLRELLIQCPVLEVRKCLIGLAEHCAQVVPSELREAFLIRLTEMLPRFPERVTKEQSSFFELLYRISRMHDSAALKFRIPLRLMYSLLGRAQELAPLPSLLPVDCDMHLGRELDLSDSKYPGSSEASPYFTTFHVALLNDLINQLDISEVSLLQDPHLVAILVGGAQGRFGGNQSARLFCSFIENSPPHDDPVCIAYVTTLIAELKRSEADFFRSPLLQLRQITSISDEYQDLRIEHVMNELTQVLVSNLTYIRITETLVVFLYKLAQRVRPVRLWLQDNTGRLAPLNTWKLRYATWSQQTTNTLQITKTFSTLSQFSDFRPNSTISQRAGSLLSCKISERITGYDSDEDLYDAPLIRSSTAEMVNKDEVRYRIVVQHCYGPALYVRYEDFPQYPVLFVASDDDRLLYSDKMRG